MSKELRKFNPELKKYLNLHNIFYYNDIFNFTSSKSKSKYK